MADSVKGCSQIIYDQNCNYHYSFVTFSLKFFSLKKIFHMLFMSKVSQSCSYFQFISVSSRKVYGCQYQRLQSSQVPPGQQSSFFCNLFFRFFSLIWRIFHMLFISRESGSSWLFFQKRKKYIFQFCTVLQYCFFNILLFAVQFVCIHLK